MQVIARRSAFCCHVPRVGESGHPRPVIGWHVAAGRPLKSPEKACWHPASQVGTGFDRPASASQPASHHRHRSSRSFPGSDKDLPYLWVEGKGQDKNRKLLLGSVFDAATAFGFTGPKRSGGRNGQPRNTGTCSDLQGRRRHGFKWAPVAAFNNPGSSRRSPGRLRKPKPVQHADPGWPCPDQGLLVV